MSAMRLKEPIEWGVLQKAADLPANLPQRLRAMPPPGGVLLCPPEHFRVVDVKNPFMEGQIGRVDPARARRQWEALRRVMGQIGLRVESVAPLPGCEDMVFTANQTFVGLDAEGRPLCVPSRMRHRSRRREVPAVSDWFRGEGYRIVELAEPGEFFEGGGDALWHPGRGLIWAGTGPRSDASIHPRLAKTFGVPVIPLQLGTDRFYHLDTCFCPLDESTVLMHPPAFSSDSLEMIRRVFPNRIEADATEAETWMACNAAVFPGRRVVIQRGAVRVNRLLEKEGFEVIEVETGEFLKSGGSVFCMKMSFWDAS